MDYVPKEGHRPGRGEAWPFDRPGPELRGGFVGPVSLNARRSPLDHLVCTWMVPSLVTQMGRILRVQISERLETGSGCLGRGRVMRGGRFSQYHVIGQ